MPVFQFIVRKIQLRHMSTEGSDFILIPCTGYATAVQYQHARKVEAIWNRQKEKMPSGQHCIAYLQKVTTSTNMTLSNTKILSVIPQFTHI